MILFSRNTYADTSTSVSLNPSVISGQSLAIGGNFTVTANIQGVTNLWGWSLGLSWDPSILQMMNYSEGSFLSSAGQTSLTASPIDNNDGTIQNINDVLLSQNSASGSGDLVSFIFQIVGDGSTGINLANVQLLGPTSSSTDSNPQIAATVANAVFNGDQSLAVQTDASASATGVLSVVLSGTTTTSSITLGPSPDPMGSTLTIDIYISGAANVWGWTIGSITWNPAVLSCNSAVEGPWLKTGGSTLYLEGAINNVAGDIGGGLSDAIDSATAVATTNAGVVATLTFKVVGYGTSPITISGAVLYASSSDTTGVTAVCNSATVDAISPTSSGATHLVVSAPSSAVAGSSFSVTVTAEDQDDNIVTGYSGTVHFTSTDGQAVLPANSGLTNGVGTFSVTLKTAGSQTVTATDVVTSSITGTSGPISVSSTAGGSPSGPIASFTPQNGTVYYVGDTVLVDASSSTPGSDGGVTCKITNYAWLVEYSNYSLFDSYSGEQISFTVSSPEYLQITLIVTAPDVNPSPSSSYTNTSTTSAWIQIENAPVQKPATIQVFTDKGGIGNANGGVYGPQELVTMYALVTYDNAPVVDKEVAFAVLFPNGTICSLTTENTNETGYATWAFRLLWPSSDPQSLFGSWSIVASVDVSQVVVTGTVKFTFNYLVNINGIQLPASVQRSQSISIKVTVLTDVPSILSVTICDSQQVPIDFSTANIAPTSAGTVTITLTFTIPSWAYVGTATVYVNVLTNLPTDGGVPLCPQQTANFQILS